MRNITWLRRAVYTVSASALCLAAAFFVVSQGTKPVHQSRSAQVHSKVVLSSYTSTARRRRAVRAERRQIAKFVREYPRLLGLFGEAHAADANAVPAAVQASLQSELASAESLGMETITDPALASQAPITKEISVDGASFWVTQDAGVICGNMVVAVTFADGQSGQTAPGGCHALTQMTTRGFVEITGSGSTTNAWGLVPSTASSVAISTGAGAPETVPVSDGAFNASFTNASPKTVTFIGANGTSVSDA